MSSEPRYLLNSNKIIKNRKQTQPVEEKQWHLPYFFHAGALYLDLNKKK